MGADILDYPTEAIMPINIILWIALFDFNKLFEKSTDKLNFSIQTNQINWNLTDLLRSNLKSAEIRGLQMGTITISVAGFELCDWLS